MRLTNLVTSLLLVGLCSANPQYPQGGDDLVEPGSPECPAYTHDCVPFFQCQNGLINTDGSGLLDQRIKPAGECTLPGDPVTPGLCCGIPGATPPPIVPLETCGDGLVCLQESTCPDTLLDLAVHDSSYDNPCYVSPGVVGICCHLPAPIIETCPAYTHECVPFYNCIDGEINTSGVGLIDVRIRPPSECDLPKDPVTPGFCCRIPGVTLPLQTCSEGLVCLEQGTCPNAAGGNVDAALLGPNYQKACYVTPDVIGTCCSPPIKVIDTCPGASSCVPDGLCLGHALDNANTYIPYVIGGSWSQCALGGDPNNPGICCQHEEVVPESPYKPADRCGIRNYGLDIRSQVKLNKNEAQFGEFPWQAILFFSNFTFKCGASVVGDRWLLTGAHCVHGYNYGDFKIRVGEWRVDTYDEPLPYVDADIASITTHPLFNPRNLHNDIAVIELTAPLKPEYHINSVCLPSPGQIIQPGFRCFASGWGKDAFEGAFQAILKKVDVPFVEHTYCQDLLRQTRLGRYFQLNKSFLCAGGEENQDACTGDGGGPLVCEDVNTGAYFLAGITAWGIDCGQKDIPGVYVDVSYFSEWINNIIPALGSVGQPAYYGK